MKRPPGLWVLLSAGVLWLSMQDAYGRRTTKTTTTTTTTTTEAPEEDEEAATTDLPSDGNVTKPTLTGNPQLDYVWDPNLPKELNGYNLSDYPFYERVPEDIDFKCDGLHDGFYASVKHKCQVYHHCLFGTRYDFLCANYTAFDQKTFICHFASEVDCANSKKFWHRNDALYKAATTTTIKPFVIYTTVPPPASPLTALPPVILNVAPIPTAPGGPRRSMGVLLPRRPYHRRRRPAQFYYEDDYYDDYYDDRPRTRGRGKRPSRPRPRPIYEDDYEDEYEDALYERKGSSRRRPYERRTSSTRRRNKGGYDDGEDDFEEDEDYRLNSRRKVKDRKKNHDLEEDYPDERKTARRRPSQSNLEANEKRHRRPSNDEYDIDDYETIERPKTKKKERLEKDSTTTTRPIIKPVSGTIYDVPRVAPKIRRPVPRNEAEKYAYKAVDKIKHEDHADAEEEELEEEKPPRKVPSRNRNENLNEGRERSTTLRSVVTTTAKEVPQEEYYDYYEDIEDAVTKEITSTTTSTTTPTTTTAATTKTTPATTTTDTAPTIERVEPQPLIRLVKRPFLPSRGGNPYNGRSLQPVGVKATNTDTKNHMEEESRQHAVMDNAKQHQEVEFKPSAMLVKTPVVLFTASGAAQEDFQPQTTDPRLIMYQQSQQQRKNPLDNKQEYDVTLNDALSPTLPPAVAYSAVNKDSYVSYSNFRPLYSPDQQHGASASSNLPSFPHQQENRYERQQQVPRNGYNVGQFVGAQEAQKARQTTQAFYARY